MELKKGDYSGKIHGLKECVGLIATHTSYTTDYNDDFHYHQNPHLSFVLQGGHFEHRKQRETRRSVGEVSFYHAGELHRTLPALPNTRNLNIEIDQDFLDRHMINEMALQMAFENNRERKLFMLKLHAEINLNDSLTALSMQALLLDFIRMTPIEGFKEATWCRQLEQLLNDEWYRNPSLEELSTKIGIHPVTISKYFPRYFGNNLGQYLRNLKVDRAIDLIRKGNTSLTEIAFTCGFSDQSHFIRAFKRCTGMKPKYFQRL